MIVFMKYIIYFIVFDVQKNEILFLFYLCLQYSLKKEILVYIVLIKEFVFILKKLKMVFVVLNDSRVGGRDVEKCFICRVIYVLSDFMKMSFLLLIFRFQVMVLKFIGKLSKFKYWYRFFSNVVFLFTLWISKRLI